MRFRDWIKKSGKTPRGKPEVEANQTLGQTGSWGKPEPEIDEDILTLGLLFWQCDRKTGSSVFEKLNLTKKNL